MAMVAVGGSLQAPTARAPGKANEGGAGNEEAMMPEAAHASRLARRPVKPRSKVARDSAMDDSRKGAEATKSTMMEHGSVRNLEQIQESDGERTPRGVTILPVALGGACIVFAGLAIGGRRSAPSAQKVDPLGELVTQQAKMGPSGAPKATDLSARNRFGKP